MSETNLKEGQPSPGPQNMGRPYTTGAACKNLMVFVAGGLIFGVAALGIGYLTAEDDALIQGGAAFGLTFVPAVATFAWMVFTYRSSPEMQLLASLGGSGVRMAIALGGGFFLTNAKPEDFRTPFWFWLVLFYLVSLAFEITLVVLQQPKADGVRAGVTIPANVGDRE